MHANIHFVFPDSAGTEPSWQVLQVMVKFPGQSSQAVDKLRYSCEGLGVNMVLLGQ